METNLFPCPCNSTISGIDALNAWREALRVYGQRPVVLLFFLGFSAGLPFLLVFTTLSAWLTDEGLGMSTIGFFSWIGITYSVKVFWAPVVDHVRIPVLGRWFGQRRSWILLAQAGIAAGLFTLSMLKVADDPAFFAAICVAIAFSSATQDIAIDAYRIEIAEDELQAALSAAYVGGYRVALLVAGAGALYLAQYWSWPLAYQVMAVLAALLMLATLAGQSARVHRPSATGLEAESVQASLVGPDRHDGPGKAAAAATTAATASATATTPTASVLAQQPAASNAVAPAPVTRVSWRRRAVQFLTHAAIEPFLDFFKRYRWSAVWLLMLVGCYRISDIIMGSMANPFYLSLGFDKVQIADITKIFGFFMTLFGAAAGGVLVKRYGIAPLLVIGAVLVSGTNVMFAWLAVSEPEMWRLAVTISLDNLSGGLAIVAFIAFLSSLTSEQFTATQYALFSSLMTLPGKVVSGFSGTYIEQNGFADFFLGAALLGLPAILLALLWWWQRPVPDGRVNLSPPGHA